MLYFYYILMENQQDIETQNIPTADQNPLNQRSADLTPVKPKPNFWMISTVVLCLAIIVGGIFYFLKTKKENEALPAANTSDVVPTNEPAAINLAANLEPIKSNQIVTGGIKLTYPDEWIPIFAVPKEGKNQIYFAKTEAEAQSLAICASSGCSSYGLKLEDFANYAVWQNSTIEDFIKQVKPDIQISNLQKTTIGNRETWLGYTDSQKTKHQLIINTSTDQSKSFTAIIASTTNPSNGMLEAYIAKLPAIKVNNIQPIEAKDFTLKNGLVIELTSSFDPQESESGLLTFILESLLAPKNSVKNYHYSLYTESTKSTENSIGGPNYPQGNFLNGKYYLLTDNDQLADGSYGTPQIQINVSTPTRQNLGLYLANPKYCQQDGDCQYRANFCTIGAYNPYHQYATPWGCGMPTYENLGEQETVREQSGCQSDFDVKYDSLDCVSNSCQIVNPKPVCKQ